VTQFSSGAASGDRPQSGRTNLLAKSLRKLGDESAESRDSHRFLQRRAEEMAQVAQTQEPAGEGMKMHRRVSSTKAPETSDLAEIA
jgi:hypothetical protein